MPSPARPHRHSTAFARQRDACVLALLGQHPGTAAMLVALGWFPSKFKALKRLRKLVTRRRLRVVGTVCRKPGRPEHVYCGWRPKADNLLHEVQLTELCLRLHVGEIRRGPQVRDRALLPDAELLVDGRHLALELDRGSMGVRQVERRFRLYEGRAHLTLWVCSTPARREQLRARAGRLRATALFATLAEALADPHGPIWIDAAGGRAALPRQGGNKGGKKPGIVPGQEGGP